jgi:hypothetical protein
MRVVNMKVTGYLETCVKLYGVTSKKPEICIMLNTLLNLAWDAACKIAMKL